MMKLLGIVAGLLILFSCSSKKDTASKLSATSLYTPYNYIRDIPTPVGYLRLKTTTGTFAEWLQLIPVKKSKAVYCWDGSLKKNQSVQFAVLDIPVGKKNLQQCADAVIRLRAEYLFSQRKFPEIVFTDIANKRYQWEGGNNKRLFERYLEQVFGWCGSASLEQQLTPLNEQQLIEPGNVFIKGGFPGHAMIVVDVAVNRHGERIFMLAQSYMPAQDIHIVLNPVDKGLSPWYALTDTIVTPEWVFYKSQLRKW